jgi:biotin transport system substrate-specific component
LNRTKIRRTVLSAVFTALIAASAFFTIPVGPVPIVLTTMFIVLSGMLGGARIGISAVAVYLILGAAGLPVFAGGTAGLAKFAGPTGGFLFGYLLGGLGGGLFYRPKEDDSLPLRVVKAAAAALLAGALIYLPGLPWLKYNLSLDWSKTLQAGLIPFIPGYLIKSAAAAALAFSLKDRFASFLAEEEE